MNENKFPLKNKHIKTNRDSDSRLGRRRGRRSLCLRGSANGPSPFSERIFSFVIYQNGTTDRTPHTITSNTLHAHPPHTANAPARPRPPLMRNISAPPLTASWTLGQQARHERTLRYLCSKRKSTSHLLAARKTGRHQTKSRERDRRGTHVTAQAPSACGCGFACAGCAPALVLLNFVFL